MSGSAPAQHTRPPSPALPRPIDAALATGQAALGLSLLVSTAGVSLSLFALGLIALALLPRVWRCAPWREPALAFGLLLLLFIALHTLWTSGVTGAAAGTINRYHELLMAPVLYALFRIVSRRRAFFVALSAAAVFYALLQWAATFHAPLAEYLKPRRISAGFGLAVCAFVLLQESAGLQGRARLAAQLAAAFLAATVLLRIDGRTGQVVLLVLAGWAAWVHAPRRWRWPAALALPLLLAGGVLLLGSDAVHERIRETLAGSRPADGAPTPTSLRLAILHNSTALAAEHFAAGVGYGNYRQVHDAAGMQPPHLDNPHNEYLMQLVGGGAVALALFVAWLAAAALRRRGGRIDPTLAGVVLAFAVGCMFNSLLMDFVEGHLYAALLAWLLARGDAPRAGA